MKNKLILPLEKKQKDETSRRDSSSPPCNPSVLFREGSEFALRASSSVPAKRKKFITRMREINSQPPVNLASSYDPDSFPSQQLFLSARAKNNLAARISRRRKKMYIELLEEQNTNLEMEVFSVGEEIEMLRTEIFNAIMHADEVPSGSSQIHSLVIKKLQSLSQVVPRHPQTDAEINICLDSCIYRIGASGSERMAILDILYKGFVNRNLPNIYRFILWSSLRGFDRNCVDSWWELMQSDLMKDSYNRFLDEQGDGIAFKGREILRCAQQILRKKRQIEESGHLFDRLIKDLRETLAPAQFAQLFLFAERATPKRELQLFEGEAIPDLCEGSRLEHSLASPARKRRKMTESARQPVPGGEG